MSGEALGRDLLGEVKEESLDEVREQHRAYFGHSHQRHI